MEKRSWEVEVQLDEATGELILPLPDDLLAAQGWKTGDELDWIDNGDGSWTIQKANK